MKKTGTKLLFLSLLALLILPAGAQPGATSQDTEDQKMIASAVRGPAEVNLQGVAVLTLPRGTAFLPASAAAPLLARMGNVVRPDLLGLVIAGGVDSMVVLEAAMDGHVPDGDTGALDADKLLKRLQRETQDDRKRHEQGLETLRASGWVDAPRYDGERHQLFWAVEYQTIDGKGAVVRRSVNRTAVALGRGSRIGLDLVSESAETGNAPALFSALLAGLHFLAGHRYEDFDAGKDKLAPYGLSQMIAD